MFFRLGHKFYRLGHINEIMDHINTMSLVLSKLTAIQFNLKCALLVIASKTYSVLLGLSLFSDKMIVLGLKDASADCEKIQFIWLGLHIFQ